MKQISLEELLEAGCHFGHQVTRQNPKARDYVFEARDNIHIIDLGKTKEELEKAGAYVRNLAKNGGTMIVLGAKRQAEGIVKEEVARAQQKNADGIYWVTNRWIGGILTNFTEITKNFKRLERLIANLASDEEKAKYTKKEISLWEKEKNKLLTFYGGVSTMKKIPDAVFIIDTHLENLAVREAHATGVTTIGITDTNADPTLIKYPIPANDDAVGSIQLITSYIIDAWIEGRAALGEEEEKAKKAAEKAETPKKEEKKANLTELIVEQAGKSKKEVTPEVAKKEPVKKEAKPKTKKTTKKTVTEESKLT